ncbi:MAG: hypothetical protein QM770_24105 [Tepidisphaeraceae bacterium]
MKVVPAVAGMLSHVDSAARASIDERLIEIQLDDPIPTGPADGFDGRSMIVGIRASAEIRANQKPTSASDLVEAFDELKRMRRGIRRSTTTHREGASGAGEGCRGQRRTVCV